MFTNFIKKPFRIKLYIISFIALIAISKITVVADDVG